MPSAWEDSNRHIINGHVPVHVASGENPIKAGALMVIDGGFSQAYHKERRASPITRVSQPRLPACSTSLSPVLKMP